MSPPLLRNATKSQVIQLWLKGLTRDSIAIQCSISTGTVSNIIAEWRMACGTDLAENLRDLSKALRDTSTTSEQCAIGFRVNSVTTNLGLSLDELEGFFGETYSWCKLNAVNPQMVGQLLKDLEAFTTISAEHTSGQQLEARAVRISEISRYLAAKYDEKMTLEGQIAQLKTNKTQLENTLAAMDHITRQAINDAQTTKEQLKWYMDLKSRLKNDGIEVDNVSKLAATVRFIYEQNFDAPKVVQSYVDVSTLKAHNKTLVQDNDNLTNRKNQLKDQVSMLEQEAFFHQQSNKVASQLDQMGFTLKELKRLYGLLTEIDEANGLQAGFNVVEKFFNDVADDYDAKLGLENKLKQLRIEVGALTSERSRQSESLKAIPFVASTVRSLLSKGVQEKDIVNFSKMSEAYPEGIFSIIQKYEQEKQGLTDEVKSLQEKLEQVQRAQGLRCDGIINQTFMEVQSRFISQFEVMYLEISRYHEFVIKYVPFLTWAAVLLYFNQNSDHAGKGVKGTNPGTAFKKVKLKDDRYYSDRNTPIEKHRKRKQVPKLTDFL